MTRYSGGSPPMRLLIAALLVVTPAVAAAQDTTLPPIGLPLAPIGLPLAPIGLGPATPTPTLSAPSPPRGQLRPDLGGRRRDRGPAPIYVVPAYGWPGTFVPAAGAPGPSVVPEAAAPPEDPAISSKGTLYLELQPPPTGQLFVDGVFVGTLDRLGPALGLGAGTRRLEIREPGYEPFVLTAQIQPNRELVYRGALIRQPAPTDQPSVSAAAPVPAPPTRKVFYLIPGCYMGDVPPSEANLSPACDLSRTVTFRP